MRYIWFHISYFSPYTILTIQILWEYIPIIEPRFYVMILESCTNKMFLEISSLRVSCIAMYFRAQCVKILERNGFIKPATSVFDYIQTGRYSYVSNSRILCWSYRKCLSLKRHIVDTVGGEYGRTPDWRTALQYCSEIVQTVSMKCSKAVYSRYPLC